MISVLVRAARDTEALGVTLGALVPGVAAGLVGDAVVLATTPDDVIARIADAMGATLVRPRPGDDPWRSGAAAARRDWLLCLEAGDVPTEGWIRALDRFTARNDGRRFARLSRPSGLRGRLLGAAQAWLAPQVQAGDLIHRSLVTAAAGRLERPIRLPVLIERDLPSG